MPAPHALKMAITEGLGPDTLRDVFVFHFFANATSTIAATTHAFVHLAWEVGAASAAAVESGRAVVLRADFNKFYLHWWRRRQRFVFNWFRLHGFLRRWKELFGRSPNSESIHSTSRPAADVFQQFLLRAESRAVCAALSSCVSPRRLVRKTFV